jgi:hypothetical protein
MFDLMDDPERGGAGWELVDPRPIKACAPYTFFTPSAEEMALARPGDALQLGFAMVDLPDGTAERVWVTLVSRDETAWIGSVMAAETPSGIAPRGWVSFMPWHVWAVRQCRVDTIDDECRYLARAHMDPRILTGECRVGALERRDAAPSRSGFPETGWYAFADTVGPRPSDGDMYHGPIGLLLNVDDSMRRLLGAPVGSRIIRWESGWTLERP